MKVSHTVQAIVVAIGLGSCNSGPEVTPDPDKSAASITERDAIAFLTQRGHQLSVDESGTRISISPQTDSQEVTVEDIEAINALRNVVELRVIASGGIAPEIFSRFRVFPHVKLVVVHYQMPAESLRYFDKFPNVETLRFWADHYISCDHLPPLARLRVLHHESTEGDFSLEGVDRIAACRALEEIDILRPISDEGIALLRELPSLKSLIVHGDAIVAPGGGQ